MKIKDNSYAIMKFTNPQNTSFYDKVSIDYEGRSVIPLSLKSQVNNYTHINIFTTTQKDDLECYQKFTTQNLTICHLYFQDSFDNFILNNAKISFLDIDNKVINKENFLIFENSLSKRDIGFYDQTKIDWINS
jgi:hypothetical protein